MLWGTEICQSWTTECLPRGPEPEDLSHNQRETMKRALVIAAAFLLSTAAANAEIVKAWCAVTWPETNRKRATGDCDFRQAFGNVQVWMGDRYKFDFRADDRGKTYERRNTEDFISFQRGGYTLQVFQGGKPESKPGGW